MFKYLASAKGKIKKSNDVLIGKDILGSWIAKRKYERVNSYFETT
jgi:hypothetical protein